MGRWWLLRSNNQKVAIIVFFVLGLFASYITVVSLDVFFTVKDLLGPAETLCEDYPDHPQCKDDFEDEELIEYIMKKLGEPDVDCEVFSTIHMRTDCELKSHDQVMVSGFDDYDLTGDTFVRHSDSLIDQDTSDGLPAEIVFYSVYNEELHYQVVMRVELGVWKMTGLIVTEQDALVELTDSNVESILADGFLQDFNGRHNMAKDKCTSYFTGEALNACDKGEIFLDGKDEFTVISKQDDNTWLVKQHTFDLPKYYLVSFELFKNNEALVSHIELTTEPVE